MDSELRALRNLDLRDIFYHALRQVIPELTPNHVRIEQSFNNGAENNGADRGMCTHVILADLCLTAEIAEKVRSIVTEITRTGSVPDTHELQFCGDAKRLLQNLGPRAHLLNGEIREHLVAPAAQLEA